MRPGVGYPHLGVTVLFLIIHHLRNGDAVPVYRPLGSGHHAATVTRAGCLAALLTTTCLPVLAQVPPPTITFPATTA